MTSFLEPLFLRVHIRLCLHSKTNDLLSYFGFICSKQIESYPVVTAYFTYPFIFVTFQSSNHSDIVKYCSVEKKSVT